MNELEQEKIDWSNPTAEQAATIGATIATDTPTGGMPALRWWTDAEEEAAKAEAMAKGGEDAERFGTYETPIPEAPKGYGKYLTPTEIKNDKGEVTGHITSFGRYNRFTDLNGKSKWVDENGKEIATPKSMQMMEVISGERSPTQLGADADGWTKSFAERIAKQRYDALTLDEKKKKAAQYNLITSGAAARAAAQVSRGQGEIKQAKNGDYYRVVTFSASDKGGPIADANDMMAKQGRSSSLRGIVAAIRTDKDGNPLKGEKVRISIEVAPKGRVNSNSEVVVKDIDLGKAMNQYAEAFAKIEGTSIEQARRNAFYEFGEKENPLGWDVSPDEKWNAQKAKIEEEIRHNKVIEDFKRLEVAAQAKIKNAATKSNGDIELFKSLLDKNVLDAILTTNEPMKDSDGNPVADDSGAPKMMKATGKEAFDRIVSLYNLAQMISNSDNVAPKKNDGVKSEISEAEAERAKRKEEEAKGKGANGNSGTTNVNTGGTADNVNTGGITNTNTGVSEDNVNKLVDKMNGKREEEKSKSVQIREEAARKQNLEKIRKSGIDDFVVVNYEKIPNIVNKFREIVPEATEMEVLSGKWDKQLLKFAENEKDQNAVWTMQRIQNYRAWKAEDDKEKLAIQLFEEAKDESKKEGMKQGWNQKQIDKDFRDRLKVKRWQHGFR